MQAILEVGDYVCVIIGIIGVTQDDRLPIPDPPALVVSVQGDRAGRAAMQ
jgi:hypothetical protein